MSLSLMGIEKNLLRCGSEEFALRLWVFFFFQLLLDLQFQIQAAI